MAEKSAASGDGASAGKLNEIRDIIVGPPLQNLEERIEKLSRQITQLIEQEAVARIGYEKSLEEIQTELAELAKKTVRRAARHRAVATARVNRLAQRRDDGIRQFKARRQRRTTPKVFKIKRATVAEYLQRRKKYQTGGKRKPGIGRRYLIGTPVVNPGA
ncbi:MAG: hypothetical protein ONB44_01870 [candidate division KSB1 bacterium]|nr:hypothetical protein [candidate division KSB1 bacterium]MDZ7300869.1 hypothetical protein [candidate division KSB1 bacterium]MDZ7309861.1 hypothetical protein [candidate division KSB1 bacterium]